MASVKVNVFANIVGKAWSVLATFLFIPVYLKYLGIEQYSLISFAVVLHGILVMLDSGLTLTLSREFALFRPMTEKWRTFRTLENCYLYIVAFIVIMTFMGASVIANSWLKFDSIEPKYAVDCIKMIGISCAFQMLSSFYIGAFNGMERMIEVNAYRIVYSIFRAGLVIVPIVFTHSVLSFFLWQLLVDILYVFFLRYRLTPKIDLPRISIMLIEKEEIWRVGKFAGGIFMISIVAAINTQLDKLVISKTFEISELGIYSLAMSVSMGLISLTTPITSALQPRFTNMISAQKHEEVNDLYNFSFRIVSLIIISGVFILSYNAESILWIWTGDKTLASKAAIFLPFLLTGTASIAYQTIPYCIAIGNGNTIYNNILGLSSLLLTIPGYLIICNYMGSKGVALVYAVSQMIMTPIYIYFINKRFLKQGSFIVFFLKNVLIPILLIGFLNYFLSLIPLFQHRILDLIRIALIAIITLTPLYIYIKKQANN